VRRKKTVASLAAVATLLGASVLVTGTGQATAKATSGGKFGNVSKRVAVGKWNSYLIVLNTDGLAAKFPKEQLDSSAARAAAKKLVSSHDAVLKSAGISGKKVQDYTAALDGFSAHVTHAQAEKLAADPRVKLVVPDELRQPQEFTGEGESPQHGKGGRGHGGPGKATNDISSKPGETLNQFLGLTDRRGAYARGIDGTGVVVGVIDTGIWPELASFKDDSKFPAAPALEPVDGTTCDFGNTVVNPNDKPFTCNKKLVGARQMLQTYRALVGIEPGDYDSARDPEGHGTHTASTAAGDANVKATIFGRTLDYTSGIAPRAQIIAYKALGPQGGFSSDLAGAIDQAVADGVDVINYSIGGGPSLTSADAISFLFAADAGVYVAASAGNDGPGAATIGGPADLPWVTTVGANTQPRFYEGTITLGDRTKVHGSSLTLGTPHALPLVDAADLDNPLCLDDGFAPGSVTGKMVLCWRGQNGRSEKSHNVELAGGKAMILANQTDADNYFTDNFRLPTVMTNYTDGKRIAAYIDRYGNRATAQLSDTGHIGSLTDAPSMAMFSSRGPNPSAPDIIKPDITAPGVQVLAGAAPFTEDDFAQGQTFQAIAGTSMSSPVVAGVYALVKQAHPDWTPAEAKSALMTTALTDVLNNDRKSPAGPFDFGNGHVNPNASFAPGLVYPAGWNEYLGFTCGADAGLVSPATCARLEAAGVPTRVVDLNYPSIGVSALAGVETVTRTVKNVSGRKATFTASSVAPKGYTVKVSPSTLTLAADAEASFTVTITNKTAPVDQWFFGSLTWRSSQGATVRSSIAVQGSAVATAPSVSGTGTSGSVSIPVKYGYTGEYTPVATGLVPSTPLSGSVTQDPDQTIGTPDDGTGVAQLPIAISGISYARLSIALPTDDDLDLYLVGPSGDIVAQSTAGGTDELIELSHPQDGTYTLLVHGWQVVSASPLNFSIEQWLVPSGAGSLTATDPGDATTGGTATVTASWSGLPAGGDYFGAVDHEDGTGSVAQTVVEVTS
jgi:hypothetical protein